MRNLCGVNGTTHSRLCIIPLMTHDLEWIMVVNVLMPPEKKGIIIIIIGKSFFNSEHRFKYGDWGDQCKPLDFITHDTNKFLHKLFISVYPVSLEKRLYPIRAPEFVCFHIKRVTDFKLYHLQDLLNFLYTDSCYQV